MGKARSAVDLRSSFELKASSCADKVLARGPVTTIIGITSGHVLKHSIVSSTSHFYKE